MTLTSQVFKPIEDAEARTAAREIRIADEMEKERARREARQRLDAEARGPVAPPEILTLQDWLTQPEPLIRWRIESWQPADTRVILAAQYKSGKTTARDNLVRCLADGDAWLGRYQVRPVAGAVVVIDTEMSRVQLRRWLRDQHITHAERVVVIPLRGRAATLDLLNADVRALWAATLRQYGAAYVILDCLRPILDALGLDEHREVGQYLVAFDSLLSEAGVGEALIVQHMGHVGERSRGDSRLRDWPDVEWRVVRQDDNPSSPRFITCYGRDCDVPESQLAYDSTTRRLSIAGGSRQDAKTRIVLDAVVEALQAAAEPLSGRRVKEALIDSEYSKDAIDAALKAGVSDGVLSVHPGPKRSRLYQVSGSVRPVSGEHTADVVSECPPPLRGADTPDTLRRLPLSSAVPVCEPDTNTRRPNGRF